MKRPTWCNILGTVLGIAVAAPIFVMLFDRREPIHLYVGHVVPDVVRPGQKVDIEWEVEEFRQCDGELTRIIIESTGKVHTYEREPTVYHRTIKPGENRRKIFSKPLPLPDALSAGEAIYTTVGDRWCNALQKYIWPIPFVGLKVPFYVVRDKQEP